MTDSDINKDFFVPDFHGNIRITDEDCLILHLNIRSLAKHFNELVDILQDLRYSPLIIGLSECWFGLQDTMQFVLPGYNSLFNNTVGNRAAGEALFIRKDILFTQVYHNMEHTCDFLAIRIKADNFSSTDIFIFLAYRSPSLDVNAFLQCLNSFFDTNIKANDLKIGLGDWNIDLLNDGESAGSDLNALMALRGLNLILCEPTRVTDLSRTLIDVCFSSYPAGQHIAGNILTSLTDHYMIYCVIKDWRNKTKQRNESDKMVYYKVTNWPMVGNAIAEINWSTFYIEVDVNVLADNFIDVLQRIMEANSKWNNSKGNYYKIKRNPWMTNGILKAIHKKDKLSYKAKRPSVTEEEARIFLNYRNRLKKYYCC